MRFPIVGNTIYTFMLTIRKEAVLPVMQALPLPYDPMLNGQGAREGASN